ncbi:hypothetical protein [Pseudopelagicola sp. nBUS_19]|uniref:hypothetical protein n=1 Tax=unclassified Pseudopelagicola TaxID=2649563 RepID=UPI003EB7923D
MEWLVWAGASLSVVGLSGLILSIIKANTARRSGLGDKELRAEIQKIMPLNMGALFLSVIGLMVVILGVSLS